MSLFGFLVRAFRVVFDPTLVTLVTTDCGFQSNTSDNGDQK